MSASARLVVVLLAACLAGIAGAADRTWARLDGCRYVADKNNDGDSFLVQCARERFYVRLYFVDTPETELSYPQRVKEQYDHFGVTMDELTRAGERARDYVRAVLTQYPFTVYTRHATAQGRAKTVRYYALVAVEGRYLHELLLGEGLARNVGVRVTLPTGEKSRDYAAALARLEDQARQQRKGTWATSEPSRRRSAP